MATIQGATRFVEHSLCQTTWASMGGADTGTADQLARFPFHSVQFGGTGSGVGGSFGGATAVLEGSDDGVTYFTLTGENPAGGADVAISCSSAQRFDFQNVPRHIRPRTSGGTGTDLTVIVTSRSYGH
jgi:hypothetical protein